jgi:hypothetical protein
MQQAIHVSPVGQQGRLYRCEVSFGQKFHSASGTHRSLKLIKQIATDPFPYGLPRVRPHRCPPRGRPSALLARRNVTTDTPMSERTIPYIHGL